MLYPVILCGGYGTRLWPWSRNNYRKQLIQAFGKKSLLQNCLNRIKDPQQFHVPTVVTNFIQIDTLNKQIEQESIQAHIIVEPYAKGTAPAITLAALALHHQDRNAVMLVMPADIHIKNNQSFYSLLKENDLCTLNNRPLA